MRTTEVDSKLIITVDNDGSSRLEKKRETEVFTAAWDSEESSIEMAENLRIRNSKTIAEW